MLWTNSGTTLGATTFTFDMTDYDGFMVEYYKAIAYPTKYYAILQTPTGTGGSDARVIAIYDDTSSTMLYRGRVFYKSGTSMACTSGYYSYNSQYYEDRCTPEFGASKI